MARKRKAEDALAAASANPAQVIPAGPIKADFLKMMPGYRKRHDGWNQQRLQRFLDVLAYTGCVEDACRVAGMSDVAPYRAKKRYPLFAAAWDDALERSRQGLIAIAYQRAVAGRETVIIRKGEEYERRIAPSDSMLGLLIKRGDMAGGALPKAMQDIAGLEREEIITLADWRAHKRFDDSGQRVEVADPVEEKRAFVEKMSLIRTRLEEYAANHGLCPVCSQTMQVGWTHRESMATLMARGVVDPDELDG